LVLSLRRGRPHPGARRPTHAIAAERNLVKIITDAVFPVIAPPQEGRQLLTSH
jgi:hypothetical protein